MLQPGKETIQAAMIQAGDTMTGREAGLSKRIWQMAEGAEATSAHSQQRQPTVSWAILAAT